MIFNNFTQIWVPCFLALFQIYFAHGSPELDKKTCSEKMAEFSPMPNLDLKRVQGLWFIRRVGWMNNSHVRGSNFLACPAQDYKLQTNSSNIDIVFGTPKNVSNVDYGVAQISPQAPAVWNNVKFKGSPNRVFHELVLTTDYENYLVFYECEKRGVGSRMDFIALRSRRKNLNEKEKDQFTNFAVGLGWPKGNIKDLSMEPWCYPDVTN